MKSSNLLMECALGRTRGGGEGENYEEEEEGKKGEGEDFYLCHLSLART
jgi:hypothetical protein